MFIAAFVYNSQKLERTQMSFNRGMNTGIVVHLYNGILLSSIKINEFMKFLGKWMELESIILSEVA
jgi:predicted ABC-type sugar transport system permease subunit